MFYLSEIENDSIFLLLGKMGFIDFFYILVILNLKGLFFFFFLQRSIVYMFAFYMIYGLSLIQIESNTVPS